MDVKQSCNAIYMFLPIILVPRMFLDTSQSLLGHHRKSGLQSSHKGIFGSLQLASKEIRRVGCRDVKTKNRKNQMKN